MNTSGSDKQRRFTLLLVNGEKSEIDALARVFHVENYELLTAISCKEAIEILTNKTVHLVIADHAMPDMTGAELLKKIREKCPRTIIIMITDNTNVQAGMNAENAENNGDIYKLMVKPWSNEDLRLTVNRALQQYAPIDEISTNEQEKKLKEYCSTFSEYKGILGKILANKGVITHEQLDMAMEEMQSDEFITDTIARLGFTTEMEIVKAIQRHQRIDYTDLKEMNINPDIARFFTKEYCINNRIIPIKLEGKQLVIAMADPTDINMVDNITVSTGFTVIQLVTTSSAIMSRIKSIYGETTEFEISARDTDGSINYGQIDEINVLVENGEDTNLRELLTLSGVPPVIRIVNAIIIEAVRYGASDIHIEPKEGYTIVRLRIDGILFTKFKIPANIHAAIISRIKILARLDIAERRKPQDGRVAVKIRERIMDLRVSIMPTISGEKIVLRILDKSSAIKKLSELGVLGGELARLEIITKEPQGIIIATGPTGSGKTTLLYSILSEMLRSTKNFETIEDPVEYFLGEANQVYVKEITGLTFGSVLRATLRQDPDVLLVGEIRDFETADIAFKAALTGHMVLTSLHTNNAVASITRLIDIGVKPYLIASAIECIVAQRLVRKVCKHCQIKVTPDEKMVKMLKIPEKTLPEVVVGKGCKRCNDSGYQGRTGLFELFVMDDQLRHVISTNYKESEVLKHVRAGGMKTLMEVGIEKVKMGITTVEELIRVIGPPVVLERKCDQCKKLIDVNFVYCPYCGKSRHDICYKCNNLLEIEWAVCPSCGTPKPDRI